MEALQRLHNRGSISTGYEIENSLKLETDNGEKLISSQFISAGNQKTWTVSFWVKITELGTNQMYWGSSDTYHYKGTDDKMYINFRGGSENFFLGTNRVFRDTSAWYHFVIVCDATNATNTDRGRLYINGVRETDYQLDTYNNMDGNDNTAWNGSNIHSVGGQNGSSNFDVSGYMAEFHSVDGQALDPTDFGEFDQVTGIWKPKEYTGSYGTNGFYLDFKNSLDLGDDISGNSKAFTNTNITSADQATDTPTNNFCTLNPLFSGFQSTVQLPLNGATQYGLSGNNQDLSYAGTMGVTKGKWYFENYINEVGATYGARIYVGFHTFQQDYDGVQVGASTNGDALAVWKMDTGNYVAWNGGSRLVTTGLGTVNSSGAGKVVGIALNLDDNQISFYYDGSAVTNGTNLSLYNMGSQTDDGIFAIPVVQSKGSVQTANFGGYIPSNFISSAASDANGYGTFEYAPPSGYYALCTKNLEEFG